MMRPFAAGAVTRAVQVLSNEVMFHGSSPLPETWRYNNHSALQLQRMRSCVINLASQVLHCNHSSRPPRLSPPPVNFRDRFPHSRRRSRVAARHPPRPPKTAGSRLHPCFRLLVVKPLICRGLALLMRCSRTRRGSCAPSTSSSSCAATTRGPRCVFCRRARGGAGCRADSLC